MSEDTRPPIDEVLYRGHNYVHCLECAEPGGINALTRRWHAEHGSPTHRAWRKGMAEFAAAIDLLHRMKRRCE